MFARFFEVQETRTRATGALQLLLRLRGGKVGKSLPAASRTTGSISDDFQKLWLVLITDGTGTHLLESARGSFTISPCLAMEMVSILWEKVTVECAAGLN